MLWTVLQDLVSACREWMWRRQRAVDLLVLWPACKRAASDLDHAKAAFMIHAAQDPAWSSFYGRDLPSVVDALE